MSQSAFDALSLDQKIRALVEGRKPSEKQLEFAVYLIDAGVLSDAAAAAAYIEAKREFDRMQREAKGEPEKRVPKAQQIIVALQGLREHDVPNEGVTPNEAYQSAVEDSISVAGRYV